MPTIREAFEAAVRLHQAGRLEEADQVYRQILGADPGNADAWHLRGVLASQVSQHDIAIQSIGKALTLRPDFAEAYNNLGLVFDAKGNGEDAIACYRRAVALKPTYAGAHFNLGNALKVQGQIREAVACYQRAIEASPSLSNAHYNLGVAFQELGQMPAAVQSYRRVVELDPHHAGAHNNLSVILMVRGDAAGAEAHARSALAARPSDADALNNLGTALAGQARLDDAASCFRQAVEAQPDYAEAYAGLANIFKERQKYDEAIQYYRRALELKPGLAGALNNLGNVFKELEQSDEAAACYLRALEVDPQLSEARFGLGIVLLLQGREIEAADCFRRVIAQKPALADAYINLAACLRSREDAPVAIDCCRRALELEPNAVQAHINLGCALRAIDRLDEAVAHFQRALELDPEFASAHAHLGGASKEMGRMEDAVAWYRRAVELGPSEPLIQSDFLYALHFTPGWNSRAIYEEHRHWNERYVAPLCAHIQPHGNDRSPDRRLRVGYVSPDFRNHVQALFMMPLLAAHDRAEVEIFCYSGVTRPDQVTERLQSHADDWRDIAGLSDDRASELIRRDKIDILVDLTMHMARSRPLLFARKPAPVQVCWLAYPGTTGLTTIDYRLTDPLLDPAGMFEPYYSEQSWRLLDTFWCYDPLTEEPGVNALPATTSGCVKFGCLNNFCKVNDAVLRLWARVMREVSGSRLLLLAPQGSARERTLGIFEQEGITRDRICFADFLPQPDYLAQYHRIDIGLDTFPYNGHTTSLDSYWMGVPVVTLVGNTVVGRAGLSQLTNLGLKQLIAETPERFVEIAVELAGDLERLRTLRSSLREQMRSSPLMDAPRFARNIEAAYREMWRRWCAAKQAT